MPTDELAQPAAASSSLVASAAPAPESPSQRRQKEQTLFLSVLAFLLLLYVPFAGSYGLWDPWETHYGEVARQMVARGDWISLWWPGSPQDPASGVFWSKPVLTFWLMALSLKLFGLGHSDPAHFSEMTAGWRAEWALRLPFVLLGIVGVLATYQLVRRLASRRAALWAAIILATSAQWALITRQAMTDMPFVVPMTVAVVFAGLALIPHRRPSISGDSDDALRLELPRRSTRLGRFELSWPHARAFYGFLALYLLCTLPQLVVNLIQLQSFAIFVAGRSYRIAGPVAMLPFVGLFALSLYFSLQARNRRTIYLWTAYLMGALATLAKGPAGIGMPILAILVFLLCSGRLDEILGGVRRDESGKDAPAGLPALLRQLLQAEDGLELFRGALVFFCVGAPWYVAMLARHGAPFWMELIGDNYVHRAQGRHGDRGSFEYYLRQLGCGLFPWSGVVVAAALQLGRWLREGDARRQLTLLALSWFVVDFAIVTLVNTKFHHYILPALPALAILGGLLMDELLGAGEVAAGATSATGAAASPGTTSSWALLLLGIPVTFLSGRDLANFPARVGWLFNYDYVNVPGTGRPWPSTAIYGERYEYGLALYGFTIAATLATLLLGLRSSLSRPASAQQRSLESPDLGVRTLIPGGLLFLLLLGAGLLAGPALDRVSAYSSSKLPPLTELPVDLRWGFLIPAAAAGLWLLLLGWRQRRQSGLALGATALALCAVGCTTFFLDRLMIDISPHWSQKHIFASYFRLRKGPEEPVVAWMMYWRGENLYTANQIYDHRIDSAEKTVFLGDKNTEKLQTYLTSHRGRRIFFLIERHRIDSLRSLLPEAARPSLEIVDDSNNKVYLVRANL